MVWHSTVGDSAERITEGLKRALQRADAVVMTGGLGPTPDDLTRKAVAGALGRPLQLDEGVLEIDPRARPAPRPQGARLGRGPGAAAARRDRVARTRSAPRPAF